MSIDIDAIQARFDDWYGSNEDLESSGYGQADWSLRDGSDETLSHCIVREDVPDLLAEVERLSAALARVTDQGMSERIVSRLAEDECWGAPGALDFNYDGAASHLVALIHAVVAGDDA